MQRLSPRERRLLSIGYLRAKRQAQRQRDELAERFEDVLDDIHLEMRAVRNELARVRMIDHALLAERDADAWRQLN